MRRISPEKRAQFALRSQLLEDPITANRMFDELRYLERHDSGIRTDAKYLRGLVSEAMSKISELTDIKIDSPEVIVEPILPGARFVTGYNKILFYRNIRVEKTQVEVEKIAYHEAVHFVRDPLVKNELLSKGEFPINYPWVAIDEGIGDFVALYLLTGNGPEVISRLSKVHSMEALRGIFEAAKKESGDPTSNMDIMGRYLREHHYHPTEGGLIYGGSSEDVYTIGAMLTTLLYATNNFDGKTTAIEMLMHPNETLLRQIVSAASNDNGRMAFAVNNISILARDRAPGETHKAVEDLITTLRS